MTGNPFAGDDIRKETAEKRAAKAAKREKATKVLALRRTGMTFTQIADLLEITPVVAGKLFRQALQAAAQEEVEEQRGLELERLDDMQRRLMAVLTQEHLVVSNGRVMHHPDTGQPLKDVKPIIDAINTMIRVSERRSRYLGLDMPIRHEVRRIENIDDQIEQLMAELVRRGQAEAARPAQSEAPRWQPPALEAGSSSQAASPGRPDASSA